APAPLRPRPRPPALDWGLNPPAPLVEKGQAQEPPPRVAADGRDERVGQEELPPVGRPPDVPRGVVVVRQGNRLRGAFRHPETSGGRTHDKVSRPRRAQELSPAKPDCRPAPPLPPPP